MVSLSLTLACLRNDPMNRITASDYRYHALPPTSASARLAMTIASAAAIDVTDAQAAENAHWLLTQTQELDDFCNEVFDDRAPDPVRHALATLILCRRADAQRQSTDAIPGDRESAWNLLADHLSRAGLAEILQTLHGHARPDKFATYLATPDWLCLAGRAWRKQGDAHLGARRYAQAAVDYNTGAEAFRQVTGWIDRAADLYVRAADAHRWNQQPGLAAETYTMAAGIYAQVGLFELAANAYSSAALAHQAAGERRLAAVACCLSGELHMMHANTLASGGEATRADRAYALALRGFETAAAFWHHEPGCEEQVLDAETRAAKALTQLGRHRKAAQRYMWIADSYEQRHLHKQAQSTRGMAAQAYEQAARAVPETQHELAADLDWQAAKLYRQAHQHAPARAAYERAAKKYKKAAQTYLAPSSPAPTAAQVEHANALASAAYRQAARIYTEAGLHTQAADVHQRVVRLHTQAKSHVQAAHASLLVAGARLRAADACRAAGLHAEAEHAYALAAKAYESAAQAYRILPQANTTVGWLMQAAQAWWSAAKLYSEAGQHVLAAQASRKASGVLTTAGLPEWAARAAAQAQWHDLRATQPPLSRSGMVQAINQEIDKRLAGLKNGLLIASRGITLRMEQAQDVLSMDEFASEAGVEWLAISTDDTRTIFDFITAMTVQTVVRSRHPILRRPLKEEELLGGYDLLELLRQAPLDTHDALAPPTDVSIDKPNDGSISAPGDPTTSRP